jgi:hypothetical protein
MFRINAFRKCLFMLLVAAISGGLYAQTFNWRAEMFSGLIVHFAEDETTLNTQTLTAGGAGDFRLHGDFLNRQENAGIYVQLKGKMWGAFNDDPRFNLPGSWIDFQEVYGWFKTFDDRLSIYFGRMERPEYTTGGAISPNLSGTGVLASFNVLPQLDVGIRIYASAPVDETLLENGRFVPGITYNIPNIVKITGIFRNHEGFGKNEYTDEWAALALDFSAFRPFKRVGFNNVVFEFIGEQLGDFSNKGIIKTGQRFEFNISGIPIWVHGEFEQWFWMKVPNTATYAPDLSFYLSSMFGTPITEFFPTLGLYYEYGSTGFKNNFEREMSGTNFGQHTRNRSIVSIHPGINYRIGGSSNELRFEYGFFADLSTDKDPVQKFDHTLSLDFVVRIQ